MPAARSNSPCPYCDHLSPAGSKFCNDCGAALHLRPCPHCGSVNDISLSSQCSRCNGELGELGEMVAEAEAVAAPAITSATANSPPSPAEVAKVSRAPLIAVALFAVAVGSYFGLRSEPDAQPNLVVATPLPAATSAVAVVTALPVSTAVAPASAPDASSKTTADAAAAPTAPASLAKLAPPGAGRTSVRREAAAVTTNERRKATGEGLDLKQPQIGSCTDAVAALGLCTPDSTPRRP